MTDVQSREPVTRRVHERPWTADLEQPVHADSQSLVVSEARDAIAQTATGVPVDLVTHERHGHPSAYLYPALATVGRVVELTDEGRCPCGGYVTRVQIE